MLTKEIKVGEQFRWNSDQHGLSGEARVTGVMTDRQKGLSPESEDYAALWIQAIGTTGSRSQEAFEVLLGTDGKSYLDGDPVTIH